MSGYRLRRTVSARTDLLEAWLYLVEDSIDAADRLLDAIEGDCRILLTQPRVGRLRDELAEGLRSWPASTPYIVFYFIQDNEIIIARVLHHARDTSAVDTRPAQ